MKYYDVIEPKIGMTQCSNTKIVITTNKCQLGVMISECGEDIFTKGYEVFHISNMDAIFIKTAVIMVLS